MLVLPIPEDFDKLLEDGSPTAIAALGELCRVMIVAVDVAFVLVIAVLGAKDGRTYGAGKVFYMVFAIQGGDVRAPQGASAGVAQEIESTEIVGFAEGVLIRRLVGDREELGSNNFAAVLEDGSVKGQ